MRFVEEEKLLSCVHCGFCLQACPTYLETGSEADSPRGRILLIQALEEGRIEADASVRAHLDGCLGCRACEPACPAGVPYGSLIEAARPFVEQSRPLPSRLARRALARVLTAAAPRRLAGRLLRPLLGHPALARLARRIPLAPLAYAAALSADPEGTPLPRVLEARGPSRGTVALLEGCVAETAFRATNRATARLLAHAGYRVVVPAAAGCCGALPLHLGDAVASRALATKLARIAAETDADWIVPTAAGCGAHLQGLAELLPDDPHAAQLAAKVRDPLSLLAQGGLPVPPHAIAQKVAVHEPCHLIHAQHVSDEVRVLLGTITGLELVPLMEADVCCGSAGTYNLTQPAMARRLRDRKLRNIHQSGAALIAAANPGCLLQIRAGAILDEAPFEIVHPIDLLARAHGLEARTARNGG
ncbi:MAG: heterodisulfide reductase-related iron-sulfur binding cluster [Deltaproteobacteria bacterium]